MTPRTLATDRLVLRPWHERDRDAFYALNSDNEVMATIGDVLTRPESDALFDRLVQRFTGDGIGLFCLDLDGEAIGWTGLMRPSFMPGVEVGWRIRSPFWGRGYAPEAAAACLDHAFGPLGFTEVISFTAAINRNSRRVMDKLGLQHDPAADFDHPNIPIGNPLRPHVLYRTDRERWSGFTAGGLGFAANQPDTAKPGA